MPADAPRTDPARPSATPADAPRTDPARLEEPVGTTAAAALAVGTTAAAALAAAAPAGTTAAAALAAGTTAVAALAAAVPVAGTKAVAALVAAALAAAALVAGTKAAAALAVAGPAVAEAATGRLAPAVRRPRARWASGSAGRFPAAARGSPWRPAERLGQARARPEAPALPEQAEPPAQVEPGRPLAPAAAPVVAARAAAGRLAAWRGLAEAARAQARAMLLERRAARAEPLAAPVAEWPWPERAARCPVAVPPAESVRFARFAQAQLAAPAQVPEQARLAGPVQARLAGPVQAQARLVGQEQAQVPQPEAQVPQPAPSPSCRAGARARATTRRPRGHWPRRARWPAEPAAWRAHHARDRGRSRRAAQALPLASVQSGEAIPWPARWARRCRECAEERSGRFEAPRGLSPGILGLNVQSSRGRTRCSPPSSGSFPAIASAEAFAGDEQRVCL